MKKLIVLILTTFLLTVSVAAKNKIYGTFETKIRFEKDNLIYIFKYEFKERNILFITTEIKQNKNPVALYKTIDETIFIIENDNLYIVFNNNETHYLGKIISIDDNELVIQVKENNIIYNKTFLRRK